MIRIGQRPGVYLVEAHNDMSHFFPSSYQYSTYMYVDDDMWGKLLKFTDPSLMVATEEDKKMSYGLELDAMMQLPIAKKIKEAIDLNPSKSMLYQFNGRSPDKKDYVRGVATLGIRNLVVWSDFDANVLLPYHKFKANILNMTLKSKNAKEWADWNKFLKKVYSGE